jgi:hypothetical protein
MDLTFYVQSATPERVDKTGFLTEIATISGVNLKEATELFSPTFILRTNANVYQANYLYCSFTGRYYFIERFEALPGERIAVKCKVDVLHTFRNEIKASKAWVSRSAETADTSDNFDMLHNDYPFRADYDIKGCWLAGGDSPFWAFSQSARNIFMVIK